MDVHVDDVVTGHRRGDLKLGSGPRSFDPELTYAPRMEACSESGLVASTWRVVVVVVSCKELPIGVHLGGGQVQSKGKCDAQDREQCQAGGYRIVG